MSGLVYLAAPYTHPDRVAMNDRAKMINILAGGLMKRGVHVFSPISHSHSIAQDCDLPANFEFWREYDEEILSKCSALLVYQISGWDSSVGVKAEIEIAKRLDIPVFYVSVCMTFDHMISAINDITCRADPGDTCKASDAQIGGYHYVQFRIQPGYFSQVNKLGFLESNAIKYICRHRAKNGKQDIEKAIHCLQLLTEWEYDEPNSNDTN
jgi:hypothetical protein